MRAGPASCHRSIDGQADARISVAGPDATHRTVLARCSCGRGCGPDHRACAPAAPGPPRALGSQLHGACQHALAQRGVQAGLGDQVHPAAQQFLRIQQQPAQGQALVPGASVSSRSTSLPGARVDTAYRAKHPHTRHPPPLGQCQQFGAVGFDQRIHDGECRHAEPAYRAGIPRQIEPTSAQGKQARRRGQRARSRRASTWPPPHCHRPSARSQQCLRQRLWLRHYGGHIIGAQGSGILRSMYVSNGVVGCNTARAAWPRVIWWT